LTGKFGIDLGTVNTLICSQNGHILLNEPSVVTINTRTERIVAIGREARRMLGRTPKHLRVVMPLRDGVINYLDELTQEMLRRFLKNVHAGSIWPGTKLVICVPTETTKVERRAFRETGLTLKASEVYVVEEPMAAAVGEGLSVAKPSGSLIVDIGGGTSEIAVISFYGIVCSGSVRLGGSHMDEAIIQHIHRKHNLLIGRDTAEKLKINLGCASLSESGVGKMQVKGIDLVSRLPKVQSVTTHEINKSLENLVNNILQAIRNTLERTPPELSADIVSSGITLTGGGSMLWGFATQLQRATGIRVRVAENPLLSVALGSARLLRDPELLDRVHIKNL